MLTSKTIATTGRVCLLFASAAAALSWVGPRYAGVLESSVTPDAPNAPSKQLVDVNLSVHGVRDAELLAAFRARPEGNTFSGVPIFDALTPEQRVEVAKFYEVWAEWMPYQVGQAKQAQDLSGNVAKQVADLRDGLDSLSKRVSGRDDFVSALSDRVDSIKQPSPLAPGASPDVSRLVSAIKHLASASPDTTAEVTAILGG